jgi:hypothetical protein
MWTKDVLLWHRNLARQFYIYGAEILIMLFRANPESSGNKNNTSSSFYKKYGASRH